MVATRAQNEAGVATGVRSSAAAPQVRANRRLLLPRSFTKALFFLISDCAALLVAEAAAQKFLSRWPGISTAALEPKGHEAFFLPLFALCLYAMKGYANAELRRSERELELSVKGLSLGFLALLAANFVLFKGVVFSRYLIACWYLFALVMVVCARLAVRGVYAALWRKGKARQRTLFVGRPVHFSKYQELLALQRHDAYDFLGIVPLDSSEELHSAVPIVGSLAEWEQVAVKQEVQIVVVDVPISPDSYPVVSHVLRRCRELGLDVEIFTDLFDGLAPSLEFDAISGCFRYSARNGWSRQLQWACKRVVDVVVGLIGSSVTVLVMPVVWIFIQLDDPGPLFHRREYVGSDGQTHYYLKFRTMFVNADNLLHSDRELKTRFAENHKLREDPRVLRTGRLLRKYSIDEFPQFFCLLTGKLTLVGPRVISREETVRFGDFLARRMSFPPGLTGYWQVMGRQNTTYEQRVRMDMFYIDHWSLWLDLVIIGKTFWKVLIAEGAY